MTIIKQHKTDLTNIYLGYIASATSYIVHYSVTGLFDKRQNDFRTSDYNLAYGEYKEYVSLANNDQL